MTERDAESLEPALREELARGDAMIGASRPILRHLLSNDDHTMFSEEIVARVRGLLFDIARQILVAEAEAANIEDCDGFVAAREEGLSQALFHDSALLGHAHALALEAQLTERLQAESGIDPVLSPLVQDLVAVEDSAMAELTMAVLAAQARFVQQQRRMALPLGELPGDLFHQALVVMRTFAGEADSAAEQAERRLRLAYEEGAGRIALLSRLVVGLEGDLARALAVEHAGVAIFASALAAASGQERELTLLSFADRQFSRLALALRAAGLGQQALARQFLFFHPDIAVPGGFDTLAPGRAAAMLAATRADTAY